ncbi:hypothetical protein F2Q69_00026534 [Brassica cretica]|uniref:Uncharacterized protein n=1 Tax=Brassica cretica TaxID=69181 RepID=A0A8S9S1I3_BRACR|nr:hypothetical protein F2Q69_00026534 [Brassica cretica]
MNLASPPDSREDLGGDSALLKGPEDGVKLSNVVGEGDSKDKEAVVIGGQSGENLDVIVSEVEGERLEDERSLNGVDDERNELELELHESDHEDIDQQVHEEKKVGFRRG